MSDTLANVAVAAIILITACGMVGIACLVYFARQGVRR